MDLTAINPQRGAVAGNPFGQVLQLGQVTAGGGHEQRRHRAPSPRSIDGRVRARMRRSVGRLRHRRYSRSRRSMSNVLSRLRPLTCHRPVRPGFTAVRAAYSGGNIAASHSRHGRGPTSAMSPPSTLSSCGSSSRLVRRNHAPIAVTR